MRVKFRYYTFMLAVLCACVGWVQATEFPSVLSSQSIGCEGYFPQIDNQGHRVLFSDTEARYLYLYDLENGNKTTVSNTGMPGFEARFSPDGKVYYIAMHVKPNRLVFRSAHEFDPATGKTREVLAGQHGAVHAIAGTRGMAVVGENKSWNTASAGTLAWTLGTSLFIVKDGVTRTLTPVPGSVGYLWAQVSPGGDKVLFEAAGKGLYVVDLQGNVLMNTRPYIMPCWFNDDVIVAQSRGMNIVLIDAKRGNSSTIATGGCCQPMVAGDKVIYTTKKGSIKILTLGFSPAPGQSISVEDPEEEEVAQ